MSEFDIGVRVVAEVHYMKPADTMHEKVMRRQAQVKIDAMAHKLELQVKQMLLASIEAERLPHNGNEAL